MHVPVLLQEVLKYLAPQPNENFVDGTLGTGGYTKAILGLTAPLGKVLGIDLDRDAQIRAIASLNEASISSDRLIFQEGNFADIDSLIEKTKIVSFSGMVLDLGLNTDSLENSGRGFSFKKDEPLIMTLGDDWQNAPLTAAQIINSYPETDLAQLIWLYGEERYSRSIAKAIIMERKDKSILNTSQLVNIIEKAVPKNYENGRIHKATRTFQALRIVVNNELNNLQTILEKIPKIFLPQSRCVIVSFHSLEDRLVKKAFRDMKERGLAKILTPKPITSTAKEILLNPKSHSAKLRAIQII
jgi:16S rRNA (cytosine1402-N4)-methyltransferase